MYFNQTEKERHMYFNQIGTNAIYILIKQGKDAIYFNQTGKIRHIFFNQTRKNAIYI